MKLVPPYPLSRLAHCAAILAGAALLSACGATLPRDAGRPSAPTDNLETPLSKTYFGAQFGQPCLTSCQMASVQAF